MGSGVAGVVAQGVLKSQFGLPKVTAGGVHHAKVVLYFGKLWVVLRQVLINHEGFIATLELF